MTNATLNCDLCGWKREAGEPTLEIIKSWHHVACPVCGKGEIISDHDLRVFQILGAMESVSKAFDKATCGIFKKVKLRVSTANGKMEIVKTKP